MVFNPFYYLGIKLFLRDLNTLTFYAFAHSGLKARNKTPVSWLGIVTSEFLSSLAGGGFFLSASAGKAVGQVVVNGLRFLVAGAGGVFDGAVKHQAGG